MSEDFAYITDIDNWAQHWPGSVRIHDHARARWRDPGADLAIVDMDRTYLATIERLLSAQDHTPFEGMELTGWPIRTLLRGRTVFADGEAVGGPTGAYLKRPLTTEQPLTTP